MIFFNHVYELFLYFLDSFLLITKIRQKCSNLVHTGICIREEAQSTKVNSNTIDVIRRRCLKEKVNIKVKSEGSTAPLSLPTLGLFLDQSQLLSLVTHSPFL